MKTTRVTIRWPCGLHLRAAGRLVRLARCFSSRIRLRLGTCIADARSVLSLMTLNAKPGVDLEIEAAGKDEREAIRAVEAFFATPDDRDAVPLDKRRGTY